ncbi:MAG: hypothetical protein ACYDHH_11770 [Solirubrobacteraceae bacterium]
MSVWRLGRCTSLAGCGAGKFVPTEDMFVLAERANQLGAEFFERIRRALRPGIEVHDLSLIFEQVVAIKVADPDRTMQLRQRYLSVVLDGLRAKDRDSLPGPPPSWQEVSERWST